MTKRPHRSADGAYHINGKKFKELFGSRQQVMNGTAFKTAGELTKSHLMMNKWGRIVSRKKHATAKKEKRLVKHGYTAKKGKFGYVKIGKKSRKNRKSRKVKGGSDDDDDDDDNNDQDGGKRRKKVKGGSDDDDDNNDQDGGNRRKKVKGGAQDDDDDDDDNNDQDGGKRRKKAKGGAQDDDDDDDDQDQQQGGAPTTAPPKH